MHGETVAHRASHGRVIAIRSNFFGQHASRRNLERYVFPGLKYTALCNAVDHTRARLFETERRHNAILPAGPLIACILHVGFSRPTMKAERAVALCAAARPLPNLPFRDRVEAGRTLARKLATYADRRHVVVLGLPRGGVPVAFEVAKLLHAQLDVFLVRKLGVPGQEELAMGAIANNGVRVVNE
jgi:hypothetical protein